MESERVKDSVLRWLATGQTGLSSKAIAFCAIGIETNRHDYPLDPADFNRCLLLVALVPDIRDAFPKIAMLSNEWAAIIEHWDELESLFVGEAGMNWEKANRAPRTYARMQEILHGKEAA